MRADGQPVEAHIYRTVHGTDYFKIFIFRGHQYIYCKWSHNLKNNFKIGLLLHVESHIRPKSKIVSYTYAPSYLACTINPINCLKQGVMSDARIMQESFHLPSGATAGIPMTFLPNCDHDSTLLRPPAIDGGSSSWCQADVESNIYVLVYCIVS